MRACSRRRAARAAATGSSSAWSSQDCGQNSRQSAAQEARSFTRCTLTPIRQPAVLPKVPEYCRATHGDADPSSGNYYYYYAAKKRERAASARDVRDEQLKKEIMRVWEDKKRAGGCTGRGKCGSSCGGKASGRPAARWSG
jgi:hypothetical protein